MAFPRPLPPQLLALAALLLLSAPPTLAGSVTADSIVDQEGARQAALEQVPRGATVTGSRCQEIGVGGLDNPRYRCTVEYQPSPSASQPTR
ncbi:MAG: hypothetical protein ACKOZW_07240 [Cyanobium sp.]